MYILDSYSTAFKHDIVDWNDAISSVLQSFVQHINCSKWAGQRKCHFAFLSVFNYCLTSYPQFLCVPNIQMSKINDQEPLMFIVSTLSLSIGSYPSGAFHALFHNFWILFKLRQGQMWHFLFLLHLFMFYVLDNFLQTNKKSWRSSIYA